jgi:hypothetical protein
MGYFFFHNLVRFSTIALVILCFSALLLKYNGFENDESILEKAHKFFDRLIDNALIFGILVWRNSKTKST